MTALPRPWSCPTSVLLFTVLLASACAGSSSGVREAAGHHVYSQPLSQLWPQVEAFMTERGYTWRWDRLAQNELAWQSQRAIYAPARDLDMELALMRKLDPAAVSRLEKPASNASP